MKKFFYTVSKIMLPILILAYPLDIMLSTSLKNDPTFAFGEISTWNDIYSGKINADILIMGSSRAWKHISPTVLEGKLNKTVYNLGIDGNHFVMQNFRYKKYLENNVTPKIIIHSIECETLEKNKVLFNDNQYLPYMLFDNQMKKETKGIKGFEDFQYYIPLTRYFGKKNAVLNCFDFFNNNKPLRIKGYLGQDLSWDKSLNKKYQITSLIDKSTVREYEKFIRDCVERKIVLILVYSPEYKAGQKFITNRDDILKIYSNLSKKYNIPFINYSDNPICHNKKLFYNNSHLNKSGAELFSKILANDLKLYIRS